MELNDKQLEFFTNMERLFDQPGWAMITQGWEAERDALYERVFFNAKTMEDVDNARVRFGLLNELVELPKTVQQQKDQVLELDPQDG